MKNKLIFSTSFWGILLIFLGFSLLLNELLDIKIPIFTFLVSALFIYLGIKLINGNFRSQKMDNLNMFGNHLLDYNDSLKDYSNIFGEASLDLSKVEIVEDKIIDINCIFGNFKVKLSDKLNYKVESTTVFGKSLLIDKSTEGFGSLLYTPTHFDIAKPCLLIKSNVVFGNMEYTIVR
jgi:predicted membrane protein